MMRIAFSLMTVAMATLLLSHPASAQAPQDEVVYFHLDAVGSVRATTNNNGQTLERFDYLPFGETWPAGQSTTEPLRFTGAERDAATGFTYLMARYLSVNAGRFTSPDLAVFSDPSSPQSWNMYVYVTNRPLTFIDPSGHCTERSTNASVTVCGKAPEDTWLMVMQNLVALVQRYPPQVPYAPPVIPTASSAVPPYCDPVCRMSRDIADRAGTAASPEFILEWYAASAAAGLAKGIRIDVLGRGERIIQIRYMSTPLARLDYGPIPGSGGSPVLHGHFILSPGGMKKHWPIYPPGSPR